jgi:hypothetical protein
MPADYGYVGLILIQTFAFSILRLPFVLVAIFDLVTTPYFFALALWSGQLHGIGILLAGFYVASFTLLGLMASYVLEWKIRKLFLRERQLDLERGRSDALLLNILPREIIGRLKGRAPGHEGRLAGGVQRCHDARWPSGDPIVVRVGIASRPAVAGVIGRRKFAYDLWGDTVNLASRLESHGQPRRILASESVVAHLEGAYEFGPPMIVDLKGKGPTRARFLLGEDGSSGSTWLAVR